MGLLLDAECTSCGHEIEICAGLGMMGYEFEPYLCLDCCEVVDVAIKVFLSGPGAPTLYRCPDCAGANIKLFTYASWEAGDIGACPKCGEGLVLVGHGVWD